MSEDYVHGYSAAEMRRLTRMQAILNDLELAALDLGGVRRLLDVGSGLGQMARALARRLGRQAVVVGVERDARQRAAAAEQAAADGEPGLVEFRAGDATALPLTPAERGHFDLAHARFLLEHVVDPLAVVREMVAAVRPGGRIILVDDDHELLRLWPECPELSRVWREYWERYRDRGLDPLVGRRLPELLSQGGATTHSSDEPLLRRVPRDGGVRPGRRQPDRRARERRAGPRARRPGAAGGARRRSPRAGLVAHGRGRHAVVLAAAGRGNQVAGSREAPLPPLKGVGLPPACRSGRRGR